MDATANSLQGICLIQINGIIEKKLRLLEQKFDEIHEWNINSYSEFKGSSLKVNAVERPVKQVMIV